LLLHLFSNPGEPSLRYIVDACRPFLERATNPVVAYLPAASVGDPFVGVTKSVFKDLASIAHLDADAHSRDKLDASLDRATLLYIPGGNTYVLRQRLHTSGLMEAVRERVRAGLPLVAFSAGAVLCGANIMTTNDMNVCACTEFGGLRLVPYNFNVHYPQEEGGQRELRDERLWEYHEFHDNPVLALEDGAHVRVENERVDLLEGNCWLFEWGKERTMLEIGAINYSKQQA
jgi:dipeptidase E